MDWKTRMTAIVLAGGSVAACAGSAAPDDAAGSQTEAQAQQRGAPSRPNVGAMLRVQPVRLPEPSAQPAPQLGPTVVHVPICNANPDPCCRSPDAPGCRESMPEIQAEAPPWWNAPE